MRLKEVFVRSSVSRIYLVLICGCALILGSCTGGTLGKGTDDNGSDTTNAGADGYSHLSADIKLDTSLDASKVYVVDSWFSVEAALTIPAGTVIKFKADTYIATSGSGTIKAVGTAEKPIVFTAYSGSTPGYWGGVQATTKGNSFSYCKFEYAKTGLDIGDDSPAIDHCSFAYSSLLGLDATEAPAAAKITNCRFYGNEVPVRIGGEVSFDDTNLFKSADDKTANTQNAIFMNGNDIKATVSWSNIQVPYVVENWFSVDSSFSIAAGTVIKFKADTYIATSGSGTITANGSEAKPIVFTAYSGSTPGYWGGVQATTKGNSFSYCKFEYATTGLDIGTDSPTLDHCSFAYSSLLGLDATEAPAAAMITNCRFYGNNKPVRIGGTVSFDATNLFESADGAVKGNTYNGIFMDGSDISATVSWSNTKVPYVVEDWFYISASHSLNLGSGAILKFMAGMYVIIETGGTLAYDSTNIFTAYTDDAVIGDTNNDGGATLPVSGYWHGVISAGDDLNTTNFKYWSPLAG
jgi:hypothetical protein